MQSINGSIPSWFFSETFSENTWRTQAKIVYRKEFQHLFQNYNYVKKIWPNHLNKFNSVVGAAHHDIYTMSIHNKWHWNRYLSNNQIIGRITTLPAEGVLRFWKTIEKIVKSECEGDGKYDSTEKVLSRALFFLEESFLKDSWKRSVKKLFFQSQRNLLWVGHLEF